MKNICKISISLLLCLPLLGMAKSVLPLQHWQTKNGAQVYFVPIKQIPMLDIRIVFRAGSAYDGKHGGLANLVNTLLNDGAGKLNDNQIAERFDDVGASYLSDVNRDMAMIGLRVMSDDKYLKPALQTLTAVLTRPAFPIRQFKREQKQILRAIQAQQQDPDTVANIAFYRALYQNRPYGHPVLGTRQTVKKLTLKQVQQFYQHYYVAHNSMIVIVGNVNKQQAENIANSTVGKLPSGNAATGLPKITSSPKAQRQHIDFPAQQTNVYLGQVGIARNNADYFPLIVGNYVLGGGMTSLLFDHVRIKQGLAYSVYSAFAPGLSQGPFFINLQTRTDKTEQAIDIAHRTLTKFVQQGPTAAQLKLAKNFIVQTFPLGLASNEDIASVLVKMGFYHLPLNYLDTYRQHIQAVTAKQVKQAFQQHIKPNQLVLVTVGKSSSEKK